MSTNVDDMTMTFRIIVSFEEAEESTLISMPISNMLFSEWGITVDQLYEIAAKNTVRVFGAETLSMTDILLSQMAPEEREIFRQILDDAPLKQYLNANDQDQLHREALLTEALRKAIIALNK